MTPKAQRRFIRELSRNVVRETLAAVPSPAGGVGRERAAAVFLAERFADATVSFNKRLPARYRAYRKALRERGLEF